MDSRIFQEAVAGMSPDEQAALRRIGGSEVRGAAFAIRGLIGDQLDRMVAEIDRNTRQQHLRIVKP